MPDPVLFTLPPIFGRQEGLRLMQPTARRRRIGGIGGGYPLAAAAMAAVLLMSGNAAAAPADLAPAKQPGQSEPGDTTSLPTLTPDDGAYLEGTAKFAGTPTAADDDVTSLAIDGDELDAEQTVGVSRLSFDVGSNSTEARYHNYVLVNGAYRVDIGDLVNERATIEIPNEHLVKGENKVEFFAGAVESSCGTNYDDFVLSDMGLELLERGRGRRGERVHVLLRRRQLRLEHLTAEERDALLLRPE
jgi:hypothetical protein